MPASSRQHRHLIRPYLTSAILVALSASSSFAADSRSELSAAHRRWLEEVESILTEEERLGFSSLAQSYQRDAFIARFWSERGDFQDLWAMRSQLAMEQFGALLDDRTRTLQLIGPPEHILTDLCPEIFHPTEAWFYPATTQHPDGFYLLFASIGAADATGFRRWSPGQGLSGLELEPRVETDPLKHCARRREWELVVASAIAWHELMEQRELLPPDPPAWVEDFLDHTTAIDPGAPAMTARLDLTFPGRSGDRTVMQATLTVPAEVVTPSAGEPGVYRLQIDGEILRRDNLVDRFRFQFEVPSAELRDGGLPLTFQRTLLPGEYNLILRLLNPDSGSVFRNEGALSVPNPDVLPNRPISALDEANAVLTAGDHMLKIQPLAEELLTGRVRIAVDTAGPDIDRVAFVLNGKTVMSKTRPPYSVEIDLGRAPRLHSLEAIAYDATGRELAHDRVPINGGPHRFSVRLVEPRAGQRYIQSLRAAAEVHLPATEELERVDFYLNESRAATLFQPPFVQPLSLPQSQRITYVRAVAYLVDGNQTEDLVFINSPDNLAHLRINMVELYTTVNDRKGLPFAGLQRQDFVVREEGQLQDIRRFELVSDRSIHAGVVIDASTSMEEELDLAVKGALEFFTSVIQQEDRAAVIVFNDEPRLQVPFTNDLDHLARGVEGVVSEGDTALYDTLVYALYYFAGLQGKRALILISDGEDSASRHSLEETMDFAQRSGVAIYPIALGLDRRRLEARNILIKLARETGGRFFSIATARELDDIYTAIDQELRSQYLLVYQSTHEEGGAFRRVEVEVKRPGLKARTIPGYYP